MEKYDDFISISCFLGLECLVIVKKVDEKISQFFKNGLYKNLLIIEDGLVDSCFKLFFADKKFLV